MDGAQHTAPSVADDEARMYSNGPLSIAELNAKYPNRPHNHSPTMPFHELYLSLFNPLNESRKRTGPALARAKTGPHGPGHLSTTEYRRVIVERFISRWRKDVGDDFYPAMRLIVPEKDRDRAMYGLKERGIGKILVKIMKVDKAAEDAQLLLNWKLPGNTSASRMAGDFAGRCYEIISKRPVRTSVGNMSIAEVNEYLDKLAVAQKEDQQVPIFEHFYQNMNAEELLWLIRIMLRRMKVGATEKTILNVWHHQAEALFNVSSSLRRVCWELWDPALRLEDEQTGITLMDCFQPQLAQFQMKSFQKMVANMRPTEDDPEYWIEDKLDGERMQLHMTRDDDTPGGMRFGFWSRKGKDYTYLYGSGFDDENGSITRHLRNAFDDKVDSIILDGEMITWDPEADHIVAFGTLKSAVKLEQQNPFEATGHRPLFRVFDVLFLNGSPLAQYTLRDRRKALDKVVKDVYRRFEKHAYWKATKVEEIEPRLKKVIEEGSEGLVLKNPRSSYKLNSRNDDWMKVKPEYMEEFGEALDCIVIGGYYGSGHRGGNLSSFLCGLRVDTDRRAAGDDDPQKCFSFFKVGGGFKADDYGNIRHHTEGKWIDWDSKQPPIRYIELAGGRLQYEKPDVWIKPEDSVVISVKAAQVTTTDQFRTGLTLRFPRFKRLRSDRSWQNALSVGEFIDLKRKADEEVKNSEFKVERRNHPSKKLKRELSIAGNDATVGIYEGPQTKIFEGVDFCILSEGLYPSRTSKADLESLVKAHGGTLHQNPSATENMICVADKRVVKVASIIKAQERNVIRPAWIHDAINQATMDSNRGMSERFLLPFEPSHMFFQLEKDEERVSSAIDEYADSYTRDSNLDELKSCLESIAKDEEDDSESIKIDAATFLAELVNRNHDLGETKLWLFKGLNVCVEENSMITEFSLEHIQHLKMINALRFAGACVEKTISNRTTHVVVGKGCSRLRSIRATISKQKRIPRIVREEWVLDCFKEMTLLDEERYPA